MFAPFESDTGVNIKLGDDDDEDDESIEEEDTEARHFDI